MKNQQGAQGAKRLLLCQLGWTLLISTLALLFVSRTAAISAGLGGLVSVVPNAYFARQLFQYQGARQARQIVNRFYKGEAIKLLLTVVLFAMVFKWATILPLVFFLVYITTQMVFWFSPLIFNNQNRPERD